jgi:hypothetical protein
MMPKTRKVIPYVVGGVLVLIGLCFVFFLLNGIGVLDVSLVPTPTVTPSPTPLPEKKVPPPVRVWEGVTVRTICLEAAHTFPQIVGEIPEPIDETTREILAWLGLQVVTNGSDCDATLTLTLNGHAYKARYSIGNIGGSEYYTGGKVDGQMRLTTDGQAPWVFPIAGSRPISGGISQEECERLYEPRGFPFKELWLESLVDGLVQVWGPQVLVRALSEENVHSELSAHSLMSRKLVAVGPEDEVVIALIYALGDESRMLRRRAAFLLMEFAPQGEAAIPFLAQALNDEDGVTQGFADIALGRFGPEAIDVVPVLIQMAEEGKQTWRVISVLKDITGQDLGQDPALWRQWWEKRR